MAKCWHYEPVVDKDKVNCLNCVHWGGKRCKDEAELLAEWEKEHGAYERMMRQNKGVKVNG